MRRVALLLLAAGCSFNPDLSRFPACEAGACPTGSYCLAEAQRCVPECGEDCAGEVDAGFDAGSPDAGFDAGIDAGEDAGVDAGADAGVEVDAGPLLTLAAQTLAPAIETQRYSHTFMPTGGEGMYLFSIDGGVPGFSLSVGGELSTSAAPTPGSFPFSITVRDDLDRVTTPFVLEVRPFLRVANARLVDGRQGQAYSQQLSATGGQPPYTWVVDGGMPPGGVSLSDGGLLSGPPNASGTVNFGVSIIDSATPPQQASRMLSVQTIPLDLVVITVATKAAADGRVGTPYTQPLKAYGGSGTYSWSVETGTPSLPPGIALVNSPPGTWSLSGTPTTKGTSTFTLGCRDTGILTCSDQPLSITIY